MYNARKEVFLIYTEVWLLFQVHHNNFRIGEVLLWAFHLHLNDGSGNVDYVYFLIRINIIYLQRNESLES